MSKVAQRLLTFFIGVPAIIALLWFNPFGLNFIQIHIFMLAVSVLSANEFYRMLSPKFELFPRWVILLFDGIVFCSEYIFIRLGFEPQLNIWIMAILSVILMGSLVFRKSFENIITKLALSIFIIFYCGFMLAFVPALTWFGTRMQPEYATVIPRFLLILFIITIFMCDSCAWFFGILFGKNNRGRFPASPNKSVVGFIGGIFGAVVFATLVTFFNNKFDIFNTGVTFPYYKICIISLVTSLFGIIGDLIESVFKRDCGVKDSGKLIPGRGGLLDCSDSITGAIPVYFIMIYFMLYPEIQAQVQVIL